MEYFVQFGASQRKKDIDVLHQVQWRAARMVRGESHTRKDRELLSVLRRVD